MLKTKSEIARLKKVSPAAIDKFFSKHDIPAAGKKGKLLTFDCDKEPLKSYLEGRRQKADPPAETAPPKEPKPEAARKITKPLNDLLSGKMPPGRSPPSWFYAKAMKMAEDNGDAGLMTKLGQIAAKEIQDEAVQQQMIETEKAKEQIAIEKAERLKIENAIRRGLYMELSAVKLLMGRVYSVHTSTLQPLGLKLSSALAAIPDGPKKEFQIKELIDIEVYSALGTIQKHLIEYLEKDA
jgi:hypothetical protein